MKCPHCDKELPGSPCPECGTVVPDSANYCMECGFFLRQKTDDRTDDDSTDDDSGFDLKSRVLCPDGTCTGIIVNGKCTECGKKASGKK